jgi:SMC interacting uncharacterized protein involved in chromosome segregation
MILGCLGMIVVLFFWDEVFEYCCTPYVQLLEEEEEEEEGEEEKGEEEVNHIELQVISDEDEVQATNPPPIASVSKEGIV